MDELVATHVRNQFGIGGSTASPGHSRGDFLKLLFDERIIQSIKAYKSDRLRYVFPDMPDSSFKHTRG